MGTNSPKTMGAPENTNELAIPATGAGGLPSIVPYTPDPISKVMENLAALKDEQAALQDIIDNPQEIYQLPVPMDQPISFMAKLGAALSEIGGDSSFMDSLLAQKQAVADQQRTVQGQNIQLMARQKQQQQSQLMDALGAKANNLGKQLDLETEMEKYLNPKQMDFETIGAAQTYLESAVASWSINDPVAAYKRNANIRLAIEKGGYDSTEAGILDLQNMVNHRDSGEASKSRSRGLISPQRWADLQQDNFTASLAALNAGRRIDEYGNDVLDAEGNKIPLSDDELANEWMDATEQLGFIDPEVPGAEQFITRRLEQLAEAGIAAQGIVDERDRVAAETAAVVELEDMVEKWRKKIGSSFNPGKMIDYGPGRRATIGNPTGTDLGDVFSDIGGEAAKWLDSFGALLDEASSDSFNPLTESRSSFEDRQKRIAEREGQ